MDETSNTVTNTDSAPPSAEETVVEPVAAEVVSTVAPASTGEPEVADVPVIQVEAPAPEASQPEASGNENTLDSEPDPETPAPTPTPQVVERIVEKFVEKEVVKEVPVEKIVERIVEKPVEVIKEIPVEKIVYKEAEPTDASLRAYLASFLRRVGPKGRAAQHERAQKKREAVLKLFDTHEHVTHKLVMETLKFTDRDASRILATLRSEGKITLHEPSASHHGGKGTFYSRSTSATK